jgi:hypothetical protein
MPLPLTVDRRVCSLIIGEIDPMSRKIDPAVIRRSKKRKKDRETALDLVKSGIPKRQVARMLKRHQWTVQCWCKPFEAAQKVTRD